jgi:assimilatory nitrate reductase catalytic subunit
MSSQLTALQPVATTCPYCGVGCGVIATPDGVGGAAIAGDPDHPANFGRLCSKGSALGETLGLENRVLRPLRRTLSGAYEPISWDDALDEIAAGLKRISARDGPEAIAFYLSGQLLTEDYYVANKLMKGFIGSGHVDTNSRLCMASSVAGHRRAFGADLVPGCYDDLDAADLIVLVGSNAAWCHPVLAQRMQAARAKRGSGLIVIDPRRTATAEGADLFLPVAPGMDSVLFAGLLVHLADRDLLDRAYIAAHVSGFDEALANARIIAPDLAQIATRTALSEADIAAFYQRWAETPKVVTAWSQGVNQSAQGTDKVAAIIHCHLATARIGKPGSTPLSLTGQPNAMGGREVGGLANMLAAHMNYRPADIDRVRRFWNAPRMAMREGLKAVAMLDAVEAGRIKALWVMATNPAVSLPAADRVQQAMRSLELFVVSENVLSNDTIAAGPHLILPAAAWGEKDGTVTNSERRISRQRAFLPLPGEVRPDWWIICEVARRMGFGAAFAYADVSAIYREHAALTGFENGGGRVLDLGVHATLDRQGYDTLQPVQWPLPADRPNGTARLFTDGRFNTPDGKATMQLLAIPARAAETSAAFPFILNTGRVRDHWHTMTRTGLSPRLSAHISEPCVHVHPDDAAAAGIVANGFARVSNAHGAAILRVVIDPGMGKGSIFAPIHWSRATASDGRIGAAVHGFTDPYSGQPDLKGTPSALAPVAFASRGFLLSKTPISLPSGSWWARVAVNGGHGLLFASNASLDTFAGLATAGFAASEQIVLRDDMAGTYRCAAIANDRLVGALFIGPDGDPPVWDAVKAAFAAGEIGHPARHMILSGRGPDGMPDAGPTVCACFGVGLKTIRAVFEADAATTIEDLGRLLKAGTNCGSCLPEIRRIAQSAA